MSGSKLIQLMQQQARGQQNFGLELATVVAPPPALAIRIDNMALNLQGDDLIVCEHLLEHQRTYTTSAAISGSDMTEAGQGPHKHSITSISASNQTATIHTNLKADDRVVVQALPGGQQYLVIDKVVVMGA